MSFDTEAIEATIHPIDTDRLEKGGDISAAECVRITGKSPGTQDYTFALLRLRAFILTDSEARGRPLSATVRGNGIHINTDAEASEYHAKQADSGERAVYRHFRYLCSHVDVSALDADQQDEYRRRRAILGMKVQRLRDGRKLAAKIGTQTTPVIEGPSE